MTESRRVESNVRSLVATKYVGGLAVAFPSPQPYTPQAWKGTVPKQVMCNRILGRITEHAVCPAELQVGQVGQALQTRFERSRTGGQAEHEIDAVGVGLFALGRLGRGRGRA